MHQFLKGTSFWGIDSDIPHLMDSCLQERKHLSQYTGDECVYVFLFCEGFLKFFFDHQVLHFARFSIFYRFFNPDNGPLVTLPLSRVFNKSSREYKAAAMCLHTPFRPPLHLHLA